jgi:hypothetical protein
MMVMSPPLPLELEELEALLLELLDPPSMITGGGTLTMMTSRPSELLELELELLLLELLEPLIVTSSMIGG